MYVEKYIGLTCGIAVFLFDFFVSSKNVKVQAVNRDICSKNYLTITIELYSVASHMNKLSRIPFSCNLMSEIFEIIFSVAPRSALLKISGGSFWRKANHEASPS